MKEKLIFGLLGISLLFSGCGQSYPVCDEKEYVKYALDKLTSDINKKIKSEKKFSLEDLGFEVGSNTLIFSKESGDEHDSKCNIKISNKAIERAKARLEGGKWADGYTKAQTKMLVSGVDSEEDKILLERLVGLEMFRIAKILESEQKEFFWWSASDLGSIALRLEKEGLEHKTRSYKDSKSKKLITKPDIKKGE